jgi:hypothetical protein
MDDSSWSRLRFNENIRVTVAVFLFRLLQFKGRGEAAQPAPSALLRFCGFWEP